MVQEALLTILSELSHFSWFTAITNMETSAEEADMMAFLAQPFKLDRILHDDKDTNRLHNKLSLTPLDVGKISWKMVTTFENDKLFFLSLDSAVELAM